MKNSDIPIGTKYKAVFSGGVHTLIRIEPRTKTEEKYYIFDTGAALTTYQLKSMCCIAWRII